MGVHEEAVQPTENFEQIKEEEPNESPEEDVVIEDPPHEDMPISQKEGSQTVPEGQESDNEAEWQLIRPSKLAAAALSTVLLLAGGLSYMWIFVWRFQHMPVAQTLEEPLNVPGKRGLRLSRKYVSVWLKTLSTSCSLGWSRALRCCERVSCV